jgi:uncharacterized membrane protein HdeD (DUF308 family)
MFVVRGILALALGVLAFAAPQPTLAALIFVFAAYAIVDGILAIAAGVTAPGGSQWLLVIAGIVAIAIGIYTAVSPQVTAVALVLLIGAFAIVRGVGEVGTAVYLRNVIQSAWLYVLSGIVFDLPARGAGSRSFRSVAERYEARGGKELSRRDVHFFLQLNRRTAPA